MRNSPIPIRGEFVKLTKDLLVYKKTRIRKPSGVSDIPCLTTLIIPEGTIVFKSGSRGTYNLNFGKCRAEKAYVVHTHIITEDDTMGEKTEEASSLKETTLTIPRSQRHLYRADVACSGYRHMKYLSGKTVTPLFPFSTRKESCESGIHFFTDKKLALEYC